MLFNRFLFLVTILFNVASTQDIGAIISDIQVAIHSVGGTVISSLAQQLSTVSASSGILESIENGASLIGGGSPEISSIVNAASSPAVVTTAAGSSAASGSAVAMPTATQAASTSSTGSGTLITARPQLAAGMAGLAGLAAGFL